MPRRPMPALDCEEIALTALKVLFSTDVGLMSVATIGITLCMGAYYVWYFVKHMRDDAAREAAARHG
jgi:hypothetical protein